MHYELCIPHYELCIPHIDRLRRECKIQTSFIESAEDFHIHVVLHLQFVGIFSDVVDETDAERKSPNVRKYVA